MLPTPSPLNGPAPKETVMTRVLIISDTHSADPVPPDGPGQPFKHPLPKADVLLHCGDLTMVGHIEEYERCLKMLSTVDAELKLVIAGNHDITLDAEYYQRAGRMMHLGKFDPDMPGKALEMWKGEAAKQAGVTYLEEGLHEFALSTGASFTVYASPYQPEFCDWAFPYFRNQDRFSSPEDTPPNIESIAINPIPAFEERPIDIMMTHGPPMDILDTTIRGDQVGCAHLLRAVARSRPRIHAFGHIHEGWGAQKVVWREGGGYAGETVAKESGSEMRERHAAYVDVTRLEFGRETLMVNASIMDVRYRPRNAPWLVDLKLPMGA